MNNEITMGGSTSIVSLNLGRLRLPHFLFQRAKSKVEAEPVSLPSFLTEPSRSDQLCKVTIELPNGDIETKELLIQTDDIREVTMLALKKQHDIDVAKPLFVMFKDFPK